jgi:hypothetical protein
VPNFWFRLPRVTSPTVIKPRLLHAKPSPSILTPPASSAREGGSGTAVTTGVMLTESKFIDVDAIVSKFKLTLDSAKSVKAVDPVDVDAIAFKLTIDSAKADDPVDVMSTVLTVPAVTSTIVIAFATPMVSASARTVTGSNCFTLASIRITAGIVSHKSITRKRVRLAQRRVGVAYA